MEQFRREFSDCYCRLNTRTNPGGRLPFARFLVDERLLQRGRLPKQVHLVVHPKGGRPFSSKVVARSEHLWVRTLLGSDEKRIAETDQYMAVFQPVSFEEYQGRLSGPQ